MSSPFVTYFATTPNKQYTIGKKLVLKLTGKGDIFFRVNYFNLTFIYSSLSNDGCITGHSYLRLFTPSDKLDFYLTVGDMYLNSYLTIESE